MRLAAGTLRQLEEEAARYRRPVRTLAERMLEEGVRMSRHPGIVFVDRAGGRDPVLTARPRLSVWMVVLAVRGSSSLEAAARSLSLDVASIERAMAYAAAYPDEIEAAIGENEAAFERAKRLYPPALEPRPRRRGRAAAPR